MLAEDQLEQQCLQWFQECQWEALHGPDISPDGGRAERHDYRDTILAGRLLAALGRINRHIPAPALEEGIQKILKLDHPILELRNRAFYQLLLDGVPVVFRKGDGIKHDTAQLIDFANVDQNEFLVVNQYAIKGPKHTRRPDIVVFLENMAVLLSEAIEARREGTLQPAHALA